MAYEKHVDTHPDRRRPEEMELNEETISETSEVSEEQLTTEEEAPKKKMSSR